MYSKLLISFFILLQDQEITYTATEELVRQQKMNNLSNLISILSIFSITITILLILNVVKNYKLKAEINRLEHQ